VSELWRKSAVELAEMIRGREVSSREVVQAHLDRVDAVNPQLNAVVRLLPDQALAAADAADLTVADGTGIGPLHRVPFTVKENIDLAGTPTTQAVPALAEAVAPVDAPQVERLRAAGAIPFGRTNLPDFGLRVHIDSALHGLTRNPWNPQRSAGGSSGGEAAALATGMTPLGLGNDLGGSLRNPAHCCGVASIKPSTGAVPGATVIPPEDLPISFQLMAVEGVMARRIADVRAGFTAVAGQHPRDPLSVPAEFTDLAPANGRKSPCLRSRLAAAPTLTWPRRCAVPPTRSPTTASRSPRPYRPAMSRRLNCGPRSSASTCGSCNRNWTRSWAPPAANSSATRSSTCPHPT
jgi:amidase